MVRGLPSCCCGSTLEPAALEDMETLYTAGVVTLEQLEAHPEAEAYAAANASISHGRGGSRVAGTPLAKTAAGRSSDMELAWQRVLKDRAAAADANRLNALREHNPFAVAPVAADMPF